VENPRVDVVRVCCNGFIAGGEHFVIASFTHELASGRDELAGALAAALAAGPADLVR
jgi:hypothetical protein